MNETPLFMYADRPKARGVSFIKVIDGIEYDVRYELVMQARTRRRPTTTLPVPRLEAVSLFKKPVQGEEAGAGVSAARLNAADKAGGTPELRTETSRDRADAERTIAQNAAKGNDADQALGNAGDFEVPMGVERVDGEDVARTSTLREILDEADAEDEFVGQLDICLKGPKT